MADQASIKLTEQQIDVLESLSRLDGKMASKNLTAEIFPPEVRGYWAAPMDFGGRNGSHHSATATRLAKMGLVDRYKGGKVNYFQSRYKGSCGYRINDAGRALLAAIKGDSHAG